MTIRRSILVSILVGSGAWLLLWFTADARANWDSLMYHQYALEYAGVSPDEAHALSWELFVRYAPDDQVARVMALHDGEPWPVYENERWTNLYRMRPAYPLLVAAAYPVLGLRAPMAVSALVTVGFVAISFAGFGLVFGYRVAALATIAALVNSFFTHWLIFLTTDGLSILLWTSCLVATARYVQTGGRPWLVAVAATVLLLAATRPTSSLAPLVPAACATMAFVLRDPIWRRFGRATVAAGISAVGVLLVMHQLGMPGIADVLQENPTRHFALPDIPDPVNWLVRQVQWAVPHRLLPTLLGEPLLLASIVAGLSGLVVARSWVAATFLAAALIAPIAWLLHPIWSDADRILSPAWVSLSLGIALLADWALVRWREPILRATTWLTRPTGPELFPVDIER